MYIREKEGCPYLPHFCGSALVEDWEYIYRFNYRFVELIEQIYDLVVANDCDQARELYQINDIENIFRDDMIKIQDDLNNGMIYLEEDMKFLTDLRERILFIRNKI